MLHQPVTQRVPDATAKAIKVGEEGGKEESKQKIENAGTHQPAAPTPAQTYERRDKDEKAHQGYSYSNTSAQRFSQSAQCLVLVSQCDAQYL